MPPQGQQSPLAAPRPAPAAPPQARSFEDVALVLILVFILLAAVSAYAGGIFDWYRGIIGAIYTWWDGIHLYVAIFFSIINALLLLVIFRSLTKTAVIRASFERPGLQNGTEGTTTAQPAPFSFVPSSPRPEMQDSWQNINELRQSDNPSDWNIAIIRADALVDEALIYGGYEGNTFAERLEKVNRSVIPSLDRLLRAHMVRNEIAHNALEAHYSKESMDYTLESYRFALEELGML